MPPEAVVLLEITFSNTKRCISVGPFVSTISGRSAPSRVANTPSTQRTKQCGPLIATPWTSAANSKLACRSPCVAGETASCNLYLMSEAGYLVGDRSFVSAFDFFVRNEGIAIDGARVQC